jgi:hypothetical protein
MKWAMVFSAVWFATIGILLGLNQHDLPAFIGIGGIAGLIFVVLLWAISTLADRFRRRATRTAAFLGKSLFWIANIVSILAVLIGSWLAYRESYPAFFAYGFGVAAFYWILGEGVRRVLKPR